MSASPTQPMPQPDQARVVAPLPSIDRRRYAGILAHPRQVARKAGQTVCIARDAAAALNHVETDRPDLIISDISMPIIDGFALARRLRLNPALNETVLAALTGYEQESDKDRAKEAGFDHYLVKPVGLSRLQDLLACLPARAGIAADPKRRPRNDFRAAAVSSIADLSYGATNSPLTIPQLSPNSKRQALDD